MVISISKEGLPSSDTGRDSGSKADVELEALFAMSEHANNKSTYGGSSRACSTEDTPELSHALLTDKLASSRKVSRLAARLFREADRSSIGCIPIAELHASLQESKVVRLQDGHLRELLRDVQALSVSTGFTCDDEFVMCFKNFIRRLRKKSDETFDDSRQPSYTVSCDGVSGCRVINDDAAKETEGEIRPQKPYRQKVSEGRRPSLTIRVFKMCDSHDTPRKSGGVLQGLKGALIGVPGRKYSSCAGVSAVAGGDRPLTPRPPAAASGYRRRSLNSSGVEGTNSTSTTRINRPRYASLDEERLPSYHRNARIPGQSLEQLNMRGARLPTIPDRHSSAPEVVRLPPLLSVPYPDNGSSRLASVHSRGAEGPAGSMSDRNLKGGSAASEPEASNPPEDPLFELLRQGIHDICMSRAERTQRPSCMYVNKKTGHHHKLVRRSSAKSYLLAFEGINVAHDGTVKLQELIQHLENNAPALAQHAVGMFDSIHRRAVKSTKTKVPRDGIDFASLLRTLFPDTTEQEIRDIIEMCRPKEAALPPESTYLAQLDEAKGIFDELNKIGSGYLSREEMEQAGWEGLEDLFGTEGTSREVKQVSLREFFAWYTGSQEIQMFFKKKDASDGWSLPAIAARKC